MTHKAAYIHTYIPTQVHSCIVSRHCCNYAFQNAHSQFALFLSVFNIYYDYANKFTDTHTTKHMDECYVCSIYRQIQHMAVGCWLLAVK